MDSPPTLAPADAATPLGVSGYTFADLHDADRLASLYERFCEETHAADPALWLKWDAYRAAPDAPRPPIELSNLLVAMAPHVSRFVTRLFQVEPRVEAIARATRDQDDLFRFKVDFVRRRALPLVKGGAHVPAAREDDDVVAAMTAGASGDDLELAIAKAGCALLDAEKAASNKAPAPSPEPRGRRPETLVRCASARSPLSRLGHLPVSGNARLLASRRCAAAGAAVARIDAGA
jgi:hypothetical protein